MHGMVAGGAALEMSLRETLSGEMAVIIYFVPRWHLWGAFPSYSASAFAAAQCCFDCT